ncbi:MAG: hypothetical protein N2378_00765 [Chloroflexaceae bacterium]|nr:hypothetical protein [Chloroflexaceae bacterium]
MYASKLMRHTLRITGFASPPGWLGPTNLRGFPDEPHPERRRAMIAGARRSGSVPDEVARVLRHKGANRGSAKQVRPERRRCS